MAESTGKQTPIGVSYRDYIARSMPRVAKVEYDGAVAYGRDNWPKISREDNIEHAITHLFNALIGAGQDDELAHAACRVMMAIAKEELK